MPINFESLSAIYDTYGFSGYNNPRTHYSSTRHHHITTSTVTLFSSRYCIHCGDKAKPVQKETFSLHSRSHSRDYIDAGYRCTCEGALREAAALIAASAFNFTAPLPDDIRNGRKNMAPDKLKSIILSKKEVQLSDMRSKNNGLITLGECLSGFLTDDIHDEFFSTLQKDTVSGEFGRLIQLYAEEMIENYQETVRGNVEASKAKFQCAD